MLLINSVVTLLPAAVTAVFGRHFSGPPTIGTPAGFFDFPPLKVTP
jgi:hypothetical protein